jgi:hypothetical protein
MGDPDTPGRSASARGGGRGSPPRRVGFFEMTPGRWTFLSAAGTAALVFLGYVVNALGTREELQEKRREPVVVPAAFPARPVPLAGPDPAVVFREVGDTLGSAERYAANIREAADLSRTPTVMATAKQATGSVERLVSLAEVRLRTLDGRVLRPEDAAERDRLAARAAEVRRTINGVFRPTTEGKATRR